MATSSESLTTHLAMHNHSQFLDLSKLHELPDTHTWPDLHSHFDYDLRSQVPVVDLESPDLLRRLGSVCETWGVFQITGHGVPHSLLHRLELQVLRLFSLSAQQKLLALRAPDGISGYGQVRISSLYSKLMWSEGFTIAGSPEEHARKLFPHDHLQFCEVIEEYGRQMKLLAGRLMVLMLEALGLSAEEVRWCKKGFSEATSVLQLNSYPACPDPDRAMGLVAHTDSSLFTILHQSQTSGLQVMAPGEGRWVAVPPLPGALVVNVGDLFHIVSNGRCPSVVHRAVVNRTRHRLSVAYLYGPPANAEVAPVGPRAVYRAVTWPEYLGIKSKKTFDQALESIKLTPRGDDDHTYTAK
ncbi:gibberellin 3-beta-dioxygenase 1-like [Wolffia australiana]